MTKNEVEQIIITGKADGKEFLQILLHRDGTLNREGTDIDSNDDESMVIGMSDGSAFQELLESLDESLLADENMNSVYDYPDKTGTLLEYTIVFLGEKPKIIVYKFNLATHTKEVGEVFPYFYNFISRAVALTEKWYNK